MVVVQCRDESDALALTFDVVVTPFPLVTSGFDGEVCIGSVFLRNHGFGGRQCHQDHDDEGDDSPCDFNFDRFVEAGGLVSNRLAVLPNGIEHHAKHSHENDCANNQHEPVQPTLLLRDFGSAWL